MAHTRCAGGSVVASDLTIPAHGGLPVFSILRTPPEKFTPLKRGICLTPPERLQKEARSQRLRIIPVTFMHPPARHSSPVGQRFQLALGAAAALAAISLSPGSAQAFVVTVGGLQYDVTTFTGSYNNFNGSPNGNTSKFETAANGGSMPWWNSQSLAIDFSLAVGNNFGANLQYAYLANACGGGNPNICTVGVITWNGSTYGGTGVKETLENPSHPRENSRVSAGAD